MGANSKSDVPVPNSFGGAFEAGGKHPQAALGGGTRDVLFFDDFLATTDRTYPSNLKML